MLAQKARMSNHKGHEEIHKEHEKNIYYKKILVPFLASFFV